ncbi:MAG: FkbM family methyltransferase [Pseudomonadota bacterium]
MPQAEQSELSILTTYHDLDVLDVPEMVPPIRKALKEGRYERREIAAGLQLFKPGDRIIEMGAGIGVVGAVIAKHTRPAAILAVEPNYRLIDRITDLYRQNGLSHLLEVQQTLIRSEPDAPNAMEFLVRINFLGSGITIQRGHDRAERISVPVTHWSEIVARFKPNAIMMDIEGAELDFFRHADLSGVDRVVLETHRGIYGREGMQEIRGCLSAQGLARTDLSGGGVFAWERTSP